MPAILRYVPLLVVLCALISGACQPATFVVVTVRQIPEQAVTLQVLTHLDRVPAQEGLSIDIQEAAQKQEGDFGLRIPQTSSDKRLAVGVAALDAAGCLLAVGGQESGAGILLDGSALQRALVVLLPIEKECRTERPILLSVTPPRLSSRSTNLQGEEEPLTLRGWGLEPDDRLLIGGASAEDLEWKSAAELSARPPVAMGQFGPTSLTLIRADGSQISRSDLFSRFSSALAFGLAPSVVHGFGTLGPPLAVAAADA